MSVCFLTSCTQRVRLGSHYLLCTQPSHQLPTRLWDKLHALHCLHHDQRWQNTQRLGTLGFLSYYVCFVCQFSQLHAPVRLDFIPPEIQREQRSGGSVNSRLQWRWRRRRERRQKQGKRGGLRAKLHANRYKPALPSLFLANSRSLVNEMDEIRMRITSRNMESCMMIITETRLDNNVPDAAVELAGGSVHRADRTAASGKRKGDGVCIYVHNNWCTAMNTVNTHCSPDLEYLAVKCRPFYLPREFSAVPIVAIYRNSCDCGRRF